MDHQPVDLSGERDFQCGAAELVKWGSDTVQLVDYEIKTIEREELKAKLDRGDNFKLVMAMHEWGFNAAHIPGSVHYNTVEEARERLGLDDEIVVYCSDPACVASQFAYRWLTEAGYTNVRRYSGGVSDWAAAGYELESNQTSDATGGLFFLPDDAYADRRSDRQS
jgi:rhodanese-related sulfurtransferase